MLTETMHSAELCALNWFSTSGLLCNNDTTQHLFLNSSKDLVNFSVKVLGIHLDTKINWATHISEICKKF